MKKLILILGCLAGMALLPKSARATTTIIYRPGASTASCVATSPGNQTCYVSVTTPIVTVAQLANLAVTGNVVVVSDGNSATDCTVGGGTTTVVCLYGGASWAAIAGSGGGTVTVVSAGSLTSTALVTGGGSQALQTPSATSTLSSAGAMSLPAGGSVTVLGASGDSNIHIQSGPAAASFQASPLNIQSFFPLSANVFGCLNPVTLYCHLSVTQTNVTGSGGEAVGVYGVADSEAASGTTPFIYGLQGQAAFSGAGTATWLVGSTGFSQGYAGSGTVTNMASFRAIANAKFSTQTATNNYGFYSDDQSGSGAVNNYAFFSAGTAPSQFGGSVTGLSFIPSSSTLPTNGLYLPGVNDVGLAANSTEVLDCLSTACTFSTATAVSPGAANVVGLTVTGSSNAGHPHVVDFNLSGGSGGNGAYLDYAGKWTVGGSVSTPSLAITGTTADNYTGVVAPGTSAAGTGNFWFDSTDKQFESEDENSNVYKLGSHFNRVWVGAASCNNATAAPGLDLPTSNAPTAVCVTGTNVQKGALQFADSQSAQLTAFLPSNWNSAAGIDVTFVWTSSSTTNTNTVIWGVATACRNPNGTTGTDDTAFNSANTVTGNPSASGASYLQSSAITGITVTGCSPGYLAHFKFSRQTDTEPTAVNLVGVLVTQRSFEK